MELALNPACSAGDDSVNLPPRPLHFVTPASASLAADGALSVQGFGYCYQPELSAQFLAAHQGPLEISGLWEISPQVARALSQHSGVLALFTTKRTQLCDASAEALGEHQGELVLCSCHDLSERAWAGLARHRGDIRIAGPMTLSQSGAEALATHKGFLDLPWLRQLNPEAAHALSEHKGGLALGLSCQAPAAAKRRTAAVRSFLEKSQLKTLSLLAQTEDALFLNEIEQLAVEEIEALSCVKGLLSLEGLHWNTDTLAGALAKHRGHLCLSVSQSVSKASAEALSAHRGGLSLFFNFAQIPDHLETLMLAAAGGTLRVSGFKNLSKQHANTLTSHSGPLELLDCFYLSQTAAQILAKHRFALSLHVDHLSPQAATELLAHAGPLSLDIDGNLSDVTAQILSRFTGKLTCPHKIMTKIRKFTGCGDEQVATRITRHPVDHTDCAGGCCCRSREGRAV